MSMHAFKHLKENCSLNHNHYHNGFLIATLKNIYLTKNKNVSRIKSSCQTINFQVEVTNAMENNLKNIRSAPSFLW